MPTDFCRLSSIYQSFKPTNLTWEHLNKFYVFNEVKIMLYNYWKQQRKDGANIYNFISAYLIIVCMILLLTVLVILWLLLHRHLNVVQFVLYLLCASNFLQRLPGLVDFALSHQPSWGFGEEEEAEELYNARNPRKSQHVPVVGERKQSWFRIMTNYSIHNA